MTAKKFFVSYNHTDAQTVRPIVQRLASGASMWFDVDMLGGGDSLIAGMNEALTESHGFIAFIGEEYFLSTKWTAMELDAALARKIQDSAYQLVPVRLSPAITLPPLLQGFGRVDWSGVESTATEVSVALGVDLRGTNQPVRSSAHVEMLSDDQVRLLALGYLDKRPEALRRPDTKLQFSIPIGPRDTWAEFSAQRALVVDQGIKSEILHQIDTIGLKRRAAQLAQEKIDEGLLPGIQEGLEKRKTDSDRACRQAHYLLRQALSHIAINMVLVSRG